MKPLLSRIVIIGNSGSGKSYLARQLAEKLSSNVVHFDEHFWEPGGFNIKRPPEVVHNEINQLSLEDKWVMEGVFGDLAAIALENATTLVLLNKSWQECEMALLDRGSQSSKQLDPIMADKTFRDLLIWAKAYYDRENSQSLKGHMKLFTSFAKNKFEFQNRDQVDDFLKQF